MNIIINIKNTATLDRIEQLSRELNPLPASSGKWADVVESIAKEW